MSPTIELAAAVSESLFGSDHLDEKEREMLGKEYEFVNGKPEARKMGSLRHGGVGSRLLIKLGVHVEANNLGGVYGAVTTYLIGGNDRFDGAADRYHQRLLCQRRDAGADGHARLFRPAAATTRSDSGRQVSSYCFGLGPDLTPFRYKLVRNSAACSEFRLRIASIAISAFFISIFRTIPSLSS